MDISLIVNKSEIPKELLDFKIQHYKEIFKDQWEKVFKASPLLHKKEEMLVLKDLDKIVGGCIIKKGIYSVKFKDFAILPGNRGKGYARILMQGLEDIAKEHHENLLRSGKKPTDIDIMYLRSLVYLNSDNPEEADIPIFQSAHFLKKFGFSPYICNENAYPRDRHELSEEEVAALSVYRQLYPDLSTRLKVFKKKIVDNGVELKPRSKKELLALNKRQWDIVMGGLNWKLGHYRKSGEVSYKYDICPICADIGCSGVVPTGEMLKSSRPCPEENCYIYLTCMEPFRKKGFFKEDNEISGAYFEAMRKFMLAHPHKA